MPTVIFRIHLLQEPLPKDKSRIKVRILLEVSGTPVASVQEVISALQQLKFRNEDGSHEEEIDFKFHEGRLQWISNVGQVQIRGKKETLEEWEVLEKPCHELFSYTMLPHIIDIIIARRWTIISNSDEMMIFWKPEPRGPRQEAITPITRAQLRSVEEEKKNKKSRDINKESHDQEVLIDKPIKKKEAQRIMKRKIKIITKIMKKRVKKRKIKKD